MIQLIPTFITLYTNTIWIDYFSLLLALLLAPLLAPLLALLLCRLQSNISDFPDALPGNLLSNNQLAALIPNTNLIVSNGQL